MRRLAWGGLTFSFLVATSLIVVSSVRFYPSESLPVVELGIITAIGIFTAMLGYSSVSLAKRYVTFFQLWPKSNLALVRTAGVTSEATHLIPWQDFRAHQEVLPAHDRDPYLRVRLRAGKKLAFEQSTGEAPYGWAPLQRFVQKCTIPENSTLSPTTAVTDSLPAKFNRQELATSES